MHDATVASTSAESMMSSAFVVSLYFPRAGDDPRNSQWERPNRPTSPFFGAAVQAAISTGKALLK